MSPSLPTVVQRQPIAALKDLHSRNWGDAIGKFIYRAVTGRNARLIRMDRLSREPHYLTVGSVLRMCDSNSVVWGSGFLTDVCGLGLMHWKPAANECAARPASVLAVRGPLTRNKLLELGVPCPEVYGDPALLLPRFYLPPPSVRRKSNELGIVPHWTEMNSPLVRRLADDKSVRIINPVFGRLAFSSRQRHLRFIDEIVQCKRILSSSLHGLIVADAYEVPSRWITLSKVRGYEDFKFQDYFASVNRACTGPLRCEDTEDSVAQLLEGEYELGRVDTSSLWEACPFRALHS